MVFAVLLILLIFLLLAISLDVSFSDIFRIKISAHRLLLDILITFLRVSITTLCAWICGIAVGYFLFQSNILSNLLLPTINLIRHISPFAGEPSIFFVMFITLFFPTVIAVSDFFSTIPGEYIDEAQVCGASRSQLFFQIELPLILNNLLNLLRVIWGLGWSVIVAAEMLGVNSGLGFRLLDFRYLLKYPEMLVYLLVMGGLGILFDKFLFFLIKLYKNKIC
jgi:NitT/TauT family transport system permease protein